MTSRSRFSSAGAREPGRDRHGCTRKGDPAQSPHGPIGGRGEGGRARRAHSREPFGAFLRAQQIRIVQRLDLAEERVNTARGTSAAKRLGALRGEWTVEARGFGHGGGRVITGNRRGGLSDGLSFRRYGSRQERNEPS